MSASPYESIDTVDPVAAALYARLAADEQLGDLLGRTPDDVGVYDEWAPETALASYVVLGEFVETPDNALGEFGTNVVVTLHVWTRATSYVPGRAIAGRIKTLLDHQPLDVGPGLTVVAVRHEQTLNFRDPDPDLRHLPVRIRITIEQEN